MANDGQAAQRAKVAVAQMTAVGDLDANFHVCSSLVQQAHEEKCKMVFLPECFSFLGSNSGQSVEVAEPLGGPIMQKYKTLAKEQEMWLSLGGFQVH